MGQFKLVMDMVTKYPDITEFMTAAEINLRKAEKHIGSSHTIQQCVATLEMMLIDGWITGKYNPKRPRVKLDFVGNDPTQGIRDIDDTLRVKYHDGKPYACPTEEAKAKASS